MTLREVLIFVAGAVFFHMLCQLFLFFFIQFPVNLGFTTLSAAQNMIAIIINAILTILLLWWASKLRRV